MVGFDYIQAVLSHKFYVPMDDDKCYHLIEVQDNVPKRKGLIQNILIKENGISDFKLYKFDTQKADPFPFFNKDNKTVPSGIRTFCDYLAICTHNDTFNIILFELKTIEKVDSKGIEKREAKTQLQISECFAKYILDLANTTKDKNKNDYIGIEKYTFSNNNILKCIIISVIKNPPTIITNPKKSKKQTVFQHEGNNVYSGVFKLNDELALEDLFI